MIGERIGHLRVIASIGVGGMGAVWHAVDELLDRHVALKVIRPELMSRPGLAERFRSEAIVLARLQHPCIAALYGLEKRGDEFVMVMEYVDGDTLDNRIAVQGALPWPEATRITRAVLDALDHAHESGVIHRDIKPANVMITRAGRVKVMDFGIARLVGAQRQTRTGAAVGTPSYMSPEQLLGQEVDGRADVYAVGTLLYELTTAHLPFEVEGDYLRMIAQLQQIPVAPSTYRPDLPSGLDLIVARALQKEPDDRYATSGDFRDALEELEREHGVLRPYGTPATGSAPVPGAATMRGTPVSIPAVSPQSTPSFNRNSSALLTPVDSAMSVTPVPFTIDPAGNTPIDLSVPGTLAQNTAASSPEPSNRSVVAAPTPEYSSVVPPVAAVTVERTSGFPRALIAIAGIAVVAVAGVLVSQNLTQREQASAVPDSSALAPPAVLAAAPATITPAAPAAVVPVVPDSLSDSALARRLADSMKAVRRARQDSIKAARDSANRLSGASVFALDGFGGMSRADSTAARTAGRRAAEECIAMLNPPHDLSRIESLFGGDRKNVVRLAKDGKLEVTGPLGTQVAIEDANRVSVTFKGSMRWTRSNQQAGEASGAFRAIGERTGAAWATRRCLVDNDGGARF